MTLLGKSFSVVILILSAVFMVLALAVNASHRNWRDVVLTGVGGQPGLKSQIEQRTRENDQLRETRDRIQASLNREQAARRTALAALQTQLDQLEGTLRDSESRVQQLESQIAELIQTDKQNAEQLARLTQENADLRSQIRSEQQDRDLVRRAPALHQARSRAQAA